MKMLFFIISLILTFSLNSFANQQPIVVLVPGFISSLAPGYMRLHPNLQIKPYFSEAIVESFESRGLETHVADNLYPLGTLEQDGVQLISYLRKLQLKTGNRPMILVGHSAGGFYSLYAIAHDPSLRIAGLFTIATPYLGASLVDHIGDDLPLFDKIANLIDFHTVQEFRRARVNQFLWSLTLPRNLKVVTFAPKQSAGGLLGWTDAKNLSWPMVIAKKLAQDSESDGIVNPDSALGRGMWFAQPSNIEFPLEHWEQVVDYRVFTLLGVRNVGYIKREQQKFYSRLADQIVAQKY